MKQPRAWLTILVLAGIGTLAVRLAWAAPPPPSFWNFTITNGTGADVEAIDVKLYKAAPPTYATLEATPIQLSLSALPDDGSVVVTLKKSWGIARITAQAKCGGKPLQHELVLQTPLQDYDGDGDKEYSGFCYQAPTGKINYMPTLEFRLEGGQPLGELRGKWRWDAHWPDDPLTDMAPCQ